MNRRPILLAAALTLASAAAARAAEPTRDELMSRVEELQSRIAALESNRSAADVDRTVEAVLRDADARSQFLMAGEGGGAGHDERGFFIRSDNFELRPALQMQFRFVTSWAEAGKRGEDSDTESGFELRRLRLNLSGYVFTPKLKYDILFQTSRSTGAVSLESAWMTYELAEQYTVKAGQFKDPVSHEQITSSFRLLAVDRSLLDVTLGTGQYEYVQGVSLMYGNAANPLHAEVVAHDGAGSSNTDYLDEPAATGAATREYFGLTGRVEWKPLGEWADYREFSARATKKDLLVLGAGLDWTEGQFNDGAATNAGGDEFFSALDIQYKMPEPRLSLYAGLLANYTHFRDSTVGDNRLNWGVMTQAGYMLNNHWEAFARYDITVMDDDFQPAGAGDSFSEITVGANYYMGKDGSAGQSGKVGIDLSYLPDGSPISATGLGIPSATDQPLLVLRAQLQLQM